MLTANEVLKSLMKEQKISMEKLGGRIGITKNSVYDRLNSNLSVNNFIQMLAVMDYEVVIQPKSGAKKPNGAYVVERSSK